MHHSVAILFHIVERAPFKGDRAKRMLVIDHSLFTHELVLQINGDLIVTSLDVGAAWGPCTDLIICFFYRHVVLSKDHLIVIRYSFMVG